MDEHAQVLARDAHPLAHAVAVLLLEKQRGQQLAIARFEGVDDRRR